MLAAVGLASTCGQDTEKQRTDQMRLIMKVREASEKKIAIDKIEAFVGAKAAINTMHRVDFIAWSLVNIELDTKNSQVKELPSSFPAVYWMLKPKSDDWRIVGVIWTEKMEMKVFFGTVLEP